MRYCQSKVRSQVPENRINHREPLDILSDIDEEDSEGDDDDNEGDEGDDDDENDDDDGEGDENDDDNGENDDDDDGEGDENKEKEKSTKEEKEKNAKEKKSVTPLSSEDLSSLLINNGVNMLNSKFVAEQEGAVHVYLVQLINQDAGLTETFRKHAESSPSLKPFAESFNNVVYLAGPDYNKPVLRYTN